jgi:hypothetical protein
VPPPPPWAASGAPGAALRSRGSTSAGWLLRQRWGLRAGHRPSAASAPALSAHRTLAPAPPQLPRQLDKQQVRQVQCTLDRGRRLSVTAPLPGDSCDSGGGSAPRPCSWRASCTRPCEAGRAAPCGAWAARAAGRSVGLLGGRCWGRGCAGAMPCCCDAAAPPAPPCPPRLPPTHPHKHKQTNREKHWRPPSGPCRPPHCR